MNNEYTCAMCKGVFKRITPEDEVLAELKEFFGAVSVDDCELVCDDCWEKIRPDKHGFALSILNSDMPGLQN